MAGGPTSLSCCFCLAPARPAWGPLLPRPLRVGPAPASLRLRSSLFDLVAGPNRILSPSSAFRLYWPPCSPGRQEQGSLARLPSTLSLVHGRQRDLGSSYWVGPGFSWPGSLSRSGAAGPSHRLGACGISSERGAPPQLIPLRRRLRAIKRLDPKLQHQVLREGLGRPRCQRAQRLLKRGDPQSVSARCPFFLQQLKPRLRLWKKALTAEDLPPPLYPEVAFAGRSNAGKSTLLNELCGRSGTAAVSRRPGSTQELFFFKAGSPCCLCLVDLPGYGYAEADAAKRLQWTEMSLYYLKARPNLKRVFLLVDARWGLKASDVCLLSFFERHRIPFQLVLTKADLPEQKSLIKILQIVSEEAKKFKGCAGPPLAVSALRHRGLDPLRAEIEKLRLSKELVIGRLRLKAANLAEARRLKKEARKRDRAMSSSSKAEQAKVTTVPGKAAATPPGAPEEQSQPQSQIKQQQQQQARVQGLDDPVARALERWGASLANTAVGSLKSGQTQREGALVGDKLDGIAAGEDPRAEGEDRRECETLTRVSISSQAEAEFEAGDVSALMKKNSLSSALDAAVDRAAGALPMPDVSCAEALIRELLPPSSCRASQALESTQPQLEVHAEALLDRSAKDMRTDASSPAGSFPETLHSSSLPNVTRSRSREEPDDRAWASTVYQEIRLDPATAPGDSGAAAGSAWLQSWGSQGVGFKGHGDDDSSLEPPFPSPKTSPFLEQSSKQEEAQLQLSGEQKNLRAAVPADTWEAPARPASKRPLDLLRANDWRARRVGRAAVEIDMALPERQEAAGNVEALHLGLYDGNDKSCAPGESSSLSGRARILPAEVEGGSGPLPDLNAVLKAQTLQHQQQQRQSNIHTHKDPVYRRVPSRAPLGGAVFLDEETLAADDLGSSATRVRARIGSAPDPSSYTGAHELDMQRSFDQKWRHELLPVGGVSPTSKAAERQGTSGGAQRSKAGRSNPFRIPEGYIGTNADCAKSKTKRLALEIRLQRAQEAYRPTDGSPVSEEMNRSTADSLLFSAAQRRQERRLKELAKRSNKKQSRSKEMTWDVAYRKWSRWARAHPTLAREAPRPSKAKLLADFRQKLEKKNRRRTELRQRNPVAQTALAAGRRPARQSIEEIREEAREVFVQEASR